MVISKLDKKEKEVITIVGTDTFTDSFREIIDSFLEIEQNEEKFFDLFVTFLKVIIRKKICFILTNFYWTITYPKKNLLKFL